MHLLENLRLHAQAGKIAAVDETGELSYAEVRDQSDAFAAYLLAHYDDKLPVVIVGEKQNEILSIIFGILKAGHPYVFIPQHYPAKRIHDIIEDCGAQVVASFDEGLSKDNPSFVDLSSGEAFARALDDYRGQTVPVERYAGDDDLWAIFYTSGSTGVPKGVELSGKNILVKNGLVAAQIDKYGADGIRLVNLSSYAFSISLPYVFYRAAYQGGTLYAVPRSILRNYPKLFEYIHDVNPCCITATPSFVELCLKNPKFSSEYFDNCFYVGFGGETLPKSVYEGVKERFPNVDINNGYGATETTAAPFMIFLDEATMGTVDSDIMPVGYDDGTMGRLRIVDEAGNDLPDGEIGEFWAEGDYVAAGGYHNRPDLTAKAFYTTPDGLRGFKTGDLMYRKNNCFYYCGRKDNLVKVGGYRVELEDVEFNLRKVDIVRTCAVVPVIKGESVEMLAAYVVLADGAPSKIASVQRIKREMATLVQDYMVPQKIVIVDDLPRNNSGKVDRAKLKEESRL